MAACTEWRLVVIGLLCFNLGLYNVDSSQELMKKMSLSFFKALEDCKKELSIPDDVLQGLVKFWREDYDMGNRDLGCVLLCMATKQDLIELEEFKMHHQNAHDFAKNHGADEETAKQIVSMVHECEQKFSATSDHCVRMIEVATCFRGEIHSLKWAPSMEVMIVEILADI